MNYFKFNIKNYYNNSVVFIIAEKDVYSSISSPCYATYTTVISP